MKTYDKFYINGEWVSPAGASRKFSVVNPATEEVFAEISLGSAEDVDRAVRAARAAFPSYSATSKQERIDLLKRIEQLIRSRQAELMAVASQEMGTPLSAVAHVSGSADNFKTLAEVLGNYEFDKVEGPNLIRREAIGVCGLIAPWNWPVQTICTKFAAALAAGCTVVLKPSEFTSITAIMLAEIFHEAGVPKGVFNLVNGDGPTVGTAISSHPDVDMVSFTGSTRAGIQVAMAAAPTVKRVSQELGGKSAHIVLRDADLQAAARWQISRGCFNSGQSCHSPTRLLVHESQAEQMLELLAAEAGKFVIGDPKQASTSLGPVVNRAQFEKIQGYIAKGIEEGARPVCGGPGRPAGLERGFYVQPTVFADVRPEMTIAREEIFGPVLSVITYRDEDEAVEIANGTPYGLGGYVSATDMVKARAIGERIRAGRIFVNGSPSNTAAPMGGYKQSGNGREMGVFGLEEYLEVKAMMGYV